MNKIGLAVVTYVYNFGSFLQSFATIEAIKKMGYSPEVININGLRRDIGKRRKKYFAKRVFNREEFRSYIVTLKGILRLKIDPKYRNNIKQRIKVFDEFSHEYFRFSHDFKSWEELTNYCKDNYSSVVVGSDQLWRPVNIEGDFYTLNFVPESINKIAYATSFGVSSLPNKQALKAKKFLPRINHLSVREYSGKQLVNDLIGREAEVVCDPTMLLNKEEWLNYSTAKPNKVHGNYILCYFLGSNIKYLEFAKRLREKTGLKIIGLVHCAGYNKKVGLYMDEMPFDIDPFDFINIVKNANFILTDSFHCCVFSILMEKEFFAFRRFSDKDKMSTNGRLTTLFATCGIEGRLLTGEENVSEVICSPIDYSKVNIKLAEKREFSNHFLKESLRLSNE